MGTVHTHLPAMRSDRSYARYWQWQGHPLTWGERLALTIFALAAIPVLLLVLAGLFLFAIGLATVALAGWLVAALMRPSRPSARPQHPVIDADYRRVSEDRETRVSSNPWEGR